MSSIDLRNEKSISLGVACRDVIPEYTGKPVSPQSGYRYIRRGILAGDGQRVRLGAVKVGRCHVTTREAVARFFDELAARSGGAVVRNDATVKPSLMAQGLISNASQR